MCPTNQVSSSVSFGPVRGKSAEKSSIDGTAYAGTGFGGPLECILAYPAFLNFLVSPAIALSY